MFRGYDGVYCVATKADPTVDPPIKPGELLWKSETESGLFQMMDVMGKRTTTDQWLSNYVGGPFGILTENPLLGTLSHDGQNVYFVDDLAVPPHPNFWGNARMTGAPPAFGVYLDAVYASKLKAVNLETGKLMWKLGERSPNAPRPGFNDPRFGGLEPPGGPPPKAAVVEPPPVKQTSETFLADALFLGPPLPLAGKLYVVVEKDGLFLVCLDPGRLEQAQRQTSLIPTLMWTQKLGDPNGALPEDAMRRYQGCILAYKASSSSDQRRGRPRHRPVLAQPGLGGRLQEQQVHQQAGDERRNGHAAGRLRRPARDDERHQLRPDPGTVARQCADRGRQQGRLHRLRLGHRRVRGPARRPPGLEGPDRQARE